MFVSGVFVNGCGSKSTPWEPPFFFIFPFAIGFLGALLTDSIPQPAHRDLFLSSDSSGGFSVCLVFSLVMGSKNQVPTSNILVKGKQRTDLLQIMCFATIIFQKVWYVYTFWCFHRYFKANSMNKSHQNRVKSLPNTFRKL